MSEFVELNDTVRFGITIHHPSGGYLVNSDVIPMYFAYKNDSDVPTLSGNFSLRTGLLGTYRGSFAATTANGFAKADFVEIHASGMVDGIVGRAVIKTFVINDVFDANIVEVSGNQVEIGHFYTPSGVIGNAVWNAQLSEYTRPNTFGSGVNKIVEDIFFAGIKFVKDSTVPRDEYTVQWFRNDKPMVSGTVSNPALSVYRTSNQAPLFENAILSLNANNGSLRYNEASSLAVSGEPYIAVTSGLIDNKVRVWSNPFGLDYL